MVYIQDGVQEEDQVRRLLMNLKKIATAFGIISSPDLSVVAVLVQSSGDKSHIIF